MRTLEVTSASGNVYEITLPNAIVFAFNPNHAKIEKKSGDAVVAGFAVGVNTHKIDVANTGSSIDVCLDSLFTADIDRTKLLSSRTINLSLTIYEEEKSGNNIVERTLTTASVIAITGYLEYGQRLGGYGHANKELVRHIVWFKNFPTKVSFFNDGNKQVSLLIDGQNTDAQIVDWFSGNGLTGVGFIDINLPAFENTPYYSVTDEDQSSHDISFHNIAILSGNNPSINNSVSAFSHEHSEQFQQYTDKDTEILYITPCCRTKGLFFRWIDNRGLWQSFLFDEKNIKDDNDANNSNIADEHVENDIYYKQAFSIGGNASRTITCSAQQLDAEIYDYVRTILRSRYVELYSDGDFKRVEVKAKNCTSEYKKALKEIEIEVKVTENSILL